MNELKYVTKIVKHILEADERARNDDGWLYIKVLDFCSQRDGVSYTQMSIGDLVSHMNPTGVPIFETVRRTRQKIQQHHPELGACDKVAKFRSEKEQGYRSYALGEFKC